MDNKHITQILSKVPEKVYLKYLDRGDYIKHDNHFELLQRYIDDKTFVHLANYLDENVSIDEDNLDVYIINAVRELERENNTKIDLPLILRDIELRLAIIERESTDLVCEFLDNSPSLLMSYDTGYHFGKTEDMEDKYRNLLKIKEIIGFTTTEFDDEILEAMFDSGNLRIYFNLKPSRLIDGLFSDEIEFEENIVIGLVNDDDGTGSLWKIPINKLTLNFDHSKLRVEKTYEDSVAHFYSNDMFDNNITFKS